MRYLFLFFVLLFVSSCQEEVPETYETNAAQVLQRLNSYDLLIISPNVKSVVELYSVFEIQLATRRFDYIVKGSSGSETRKSIQVKVRIEDIKIIDDKKGNISHSVESDENVFKIRPSQLFGVNSSFKIIVDYVYEASGAEGVDGVQRTKEFLFHTTESDQMTLSMVYCEYPLERQYNFLQDEYEYGFIKTFVKPDFVLEEQPKVSLINMLSNELIEVQMVYDEVLGILKYDMPQLENNTIYRIDYLRGNNQVFFRSNYFKTSSYNRFTEKIENYFEGEFEYHKWQEAPHIYSLTVNQFGGCNELFDYYEQVLPSGIDYTSDFEKFDYPKVVSIEIDTMRFDLNVFGYNLAEEFGWKIERRPTDYIGFKPIRDFGFFKNINKEGSFYTYNDVLLSDDEIDSKSPSGLRADDYLFTTLVQDVIYHDWLEFRYPALNGGRSDARIDSLLSQNNPGTELYGDYPYKMRYIIPGINKITFEGDYKIVPRE